MQFEEIQKKIGQFIEQVQASEDILFSGAKLPVSDALFCAQDIARNRVFYRAIESAISDIRRNRPQKKIRVIDAGAGIGVLGIFALILGVDEVIFIEENKVSAELCSRFVEELGFSHKTEVICADILDMTDFSDADILISETIAIDFTSEDFHKIVTHIKPFLSPGAIIIPEKFEITLDSERGEETQKHFSSYDDISHISFEGAGTLKGKCYLYKDISIASGQCVSFFNERMFG